MVWEGQGTFFLMYLTLTEPNFKNFQLERNVLRIFLRFFFSKNCWKSAQLDSVRDIRKNVPILQVLGGSAPAPPTLPVFRLVLLHTEAFYEKILVTLILPVVLKNQDKSTLWWSIFSVLWTKACLVVTAFCLLLLYFLQREFKIHLWKLHLGGVSSTNLANSISKKLFPQIGVTYMEILYK